MMRLMLQFSVIQPVICPVFSLYLSRELSVTMILISLSAAAEPSERNLMKNSSFVPNSENLILFYEPDTDPQYAEELSQRLELPATPDRGLAEKAGLFLQLDKEGLALMGNGLFLRGDLTRLLPRLRPDNLNRELLVRAAKPKKNTKDSLSAIDATAGLGEDSLLLAGAGFTVTLYERDPVIAALLGDSLRRAAAVPEFSDIVRRMILCEKDSIEALSQQSDSPDSPDVVLLDPMFPARQKSALVKKKFQLLHFLEQPCTDEEELLQAALNAHPGRIVIKRPVKGPYLGGRKPAFSLSGKVVRYDVLIP